MAGDQEPVILFVEVVGKAAKVAPEQIDVTCVKFGVTLGFKVFDVYKLETCWALNAKS